MSVNGTDPYWKPEVFPPVERIKDRCHPGYVHPVWTRVWNIGDFSTGDYVRVVDKRAMSAGPRYNACYHVVVYGELAKIIAIIVPTNGVPFTEGGEAVVCLLELCNPDAEICKNILNTQVDNMEQLPRSDDEIRDGAGPPAYRDDKKYLCALLQNIQLPGDYVKHPTPLLSTTTGYECVRGHDGYDYDGESSNYCMAFERNSFLVAKGYRGFDSDNCGFDMREYALPLYKDWDGNPT